MIKLKIEQHFFQKDSQALKNSVTCAKGGKKKKENQTTKKQKQKHKIKTELLKTSEGVVHSSTPKAVFTFTLAALLR